MLAGGVSGAPLWHSDIGGYTSVNTGVEDFMRPRTSTPAGARCRRSDR